MPVPHVLVAGSGVAALEVVTALRALARDRVSVELLTDSAELVNRASSVLLPFGHAMRRLDIARVATDNDARCRPGRLAAVDNISEDALTEDGERISYDFLVVAIGATPRNPLPGALAFCGPESSGAFRALLSDIHLGRCRSVAFAVPGDVSWTLPLYELALLTAARARALRVGHLVLTVTTPEERPLGLFGARASESVAELLADAGVELVTGVYPESVTSTTLELRPRRTVAAERVVTLPRLVGPAIEGLPHDAHGFLEVDEHGALRGVENVYAAGDVTSFAVKQGGIAAQQADAVARSIAARAGASVEPRPFEPVLRGMLLAGTARHFLSAHIGGGHGDTSRASTLPLWWPPTKVAAQHLGVYLETVNDGAVYDGPDDPTALPVEMHLPTKPAAPFAARA